MANKTIFCITIFIFLLSLHSCNKGKTTTNLSEEEFENLYLELQMANEYSYTYAQTHVLTSTHFLDSLRQTIFSYYHTDSNAFKKEMENYATDKDRMDAMLLDVQHKLDSMQNFQLL